MSSDENNKLDAILDKLAAVERDVVAIRKRQRGVIRQVRAMGEVISGTVGGKPGFHERIRALERWRAVIAAGVGTSAALLAESVWSWITGKGGGQ